MTQASGPRMQTQDNSDDTQPPASSTTPTAKAGAWFNARDLILSLIVNGALPFITYKVLKGQGMDELPALVISGIFPAIATVISVARARRIDILGAIALVGIAVGIVAATIGGDPKLVLIRESFVTAALGVVALGSLFTPRPLMFLIGRQVSAGNDPARVASFSRAMEIPRWRRFFRALTAIWAVTWLGEFALRVILVATLSIEQVLVIAPIIFNTVTFGLIAATFLYVRRARATRA